MVRNMFKVNNKDTRTTSVTSFWCLYCQFWTYFTPFFSVSIVDVQQVIVCWVFSGTHIIHSTPVFSNPNPLISIAISIPIGFDFFMGYGNETLVWNGLKKACRASIYLLKFNNRNTTISVKYVQSLHLSHLVLAFLLLTLIMQYSDGWLISSFTSLIFMQFTRNCLPFQLVIATIHCV